MKRKVSQVGPATLMVSLPSKWAKKYNIKKGDEVEVEEDGSLLRVGTKIKSEVSSISIDLSNTGSMLPRIITAIYKAGFDEVRLRYGKADELDRIQKILDRTCHSYEIIDYRQNEIHIKAISHLEEGEFQNVLKKLFYSLQNIASELLKAMNSNNYSDMENLILQDKTVDRHSDFCRRLMNKNVDAGFNNPNAAYVIIEELEIIGDIYKDLCAEISSHKLKIEKQLIDLLGEINKLLSLMQEMFFGFKIQQTTELGDMEIRIKKIIDELFSAQKKNTKVLFILTHLFKTIFEMKSALLTEVLKKRS